MENGQTQSISAEQKVSLSISFSADLKRGHRSVCSSSNERCHSVFSQPCFQAAQKENIGSSLLRCMKTSSRWRHRRLCFVCSSLTSLVAPPAADKRSLVGANSPASQAPRPKDNPGFFRSRARLRLYRLPKKGEPFAFKVQPVSSSSDVSQLGKPV